MVFYRKYRPQKIDDLDKENIRTRLISILSGSDIPHAFLFTGSKGIGKTSTARIIAKIVNCEKRKGVEPCNTCHSCVAVSKGNHFDVIEIDAASNRGIDEIRDLRDKIAFSPSMGTKKVYIIDEVHMLTKEAFNALLKTLEEPPAHALFILATTEVHKLPDTILSRCTILTFTKATPSEIVRSLRRIVRGEKLSIGDDVLNSVARHSDGSFRDAAKLLEQIVAENTSNAGSTTQQSKDSFIVGGEAAVTSLLEFLVEYKTADAIKLIEREREKGTDFQDFIRRIIDQLHDALVERYTGKKSENTALNTLSPADIKKLIKLLSTAYVDLKSAYIEQLSLELTVIEWCEKHAIHNT